jgi:hypothetical protein
VTTMAPAAPPVVPKPAIPSVHAANPLLDWLNLTDSDGGQIAHYRLMLEPGTFDILHKVVYSGGADFCYSLGYLLGSSYATALMQLVLDPNKWLTPLTNAYYGITSRVYDKVPPTIIMAATFGVLLFSVFAVRSGTAAAGMPAQARLAGAGAAAPGLLEQWLPSNTQIAKAQWQRLGSGLVIMSLVGLLAANPFAIIRNIVDAVLEISSSLSFTQSSGGAEHVITSAGTDMIRSITFLVNYRQFLSPECAHQWSMAINVGGGNPRCLTSAQLAAADPDLWTVALAILAVFIAWAVLSFTIVIAIEFFKHLSLAVGCVIAATWIAALTLANRRPYDPLVAVAARAAVHFLLAIIVQFGASAGPSLLLHVLTSVLPVPTLFQILIAAASYYIAGKIILFVMEKEKSLLGLLTTKIKQSQTWLNLYPPNAPATVMSTAFGGVLDRPTAWTQRNYNQVRDSAAAGWNNARNAAGAWSRGQDGGDTVPTAIIDDTPEFKAATERIKLYDKPTQRIVVSGETATAETPDGSAAVAVPGPDGTVTPAAPAPSTGTQPAAPIAEPNLAPVWFRGGLPQFVPAPDQYSPPVLTPAAAAGAGQDSPAPQKAAQPTNPARPHFTRPRFSQAARTDAAYLHGVAPTPSSDAVDDVIARTTAAFRGYENLPSAADPGRIRRSGAPDLRSVLSAAQWTQRFNHHRNKLLARGIEGIPTLADDEEAVDRIVFAVDAAGQIRIEQKNDRGFGDWV